MNDERGAVLQNQKITHTVVFGDTLRSLAEQYYGSTDYWNRIWLANQQTLKNPDNVIPGQMLVIP